MAAIASSGDDAGASADDAADVVAVVVETAAVVATLVGVDGTITVVRGVVGAVVGSTAVAVVVVAVGMEGPLFSLEPQAPMTTTTAIVATNGVGRTTASLSMRPGRCQGLSSLAVNADELALCSPAQANTRASPAQGVFEAEELSRRRRRNRRRDQGLWFARPAFARFDVWTQGVGWWSLALPQTDSWTSLSRRMARSGEEAR